MCGEFGEVTVIIGLVINFLAFVSPLCAFRDTSSYELRALNITKRNKVMLHQNRKIFGNFPSPAYWQNVSTFAFFVVKCPLNMMTGGGICLFAREFGFLTKITRLIKHCFQKQTTDPKYLRFLVLKINVGTKQAIFISLDKNMSEGTKLWIFYISLGGPLLWELLCKYCKRGFIFTSGINRHIRLYQRNFYFLQEFVSK